MLIKNTFIFYSAALLLSCENTNLIKATPDVSASIKNEVTKQGQPQTDSLINLLRTMNANSLDCNAVVYWEIIKRGKASIPFLIESLTDTTMTNVYNKCKRGKLNVGEVSYFALEEIAEFPAFTVTHIQFDLIKQDGCWSFYDYLFDNKNKYDYQKMWRNFYNTNKYVYVRFNKRELTTCRKKYNIEGKYKRSE